MTERLDVIGHRRGFHGLVTKPKNAACPESSIKDLVRSQVLPYFESREEAQGFHPIYGKVRIDFLCFPGPEMLDKKWPARWFGIETKSEGLQDQRKRTSALLVRQARIYRESSYEIDSDLQDEVRPLFVLIAPQLSAILKGSDESPEFLSGYRFGLEKNGAFDQIGTLKILDSSWSVYFHSEADPAFDSRWPSWINTGQISPRKTVSRG